MVIAWRSSGAVAKVTGQGNQVIASAGYYFDKLLPGESYYAVDPYDPASCWLTHEQFVEGKANGLPALSLERGKRIDVARDIDHHAAPHQPRSVFDHHCWNGEASRRFGVGLSEIARPRRTPASPSTTSTAPSFLMASK
jgi:hypothetical protein